MLHAFEQGRGPPVCLLHGLFGRSQNLAAVARHLAAEFRVISLDLRNHGSSPHARDMSYPAMAQDVRTTLASLDALPCAMLGHSMGGKVAMVLALTEPRAVSALVVADIAPVAYAHHNKAVAAAMLGLPLSPALSRRQADAALAHAVPKADVRGFLLQNLAFGDSPAWKIGLAQIAAGMGDIEAWPVLPSGAQYGGPALFLAGGLSDYIGPAEEHAIHATFPQAELHRIAQAGHWLHADQPAAFTAAVQRFLTKTVGPAPASG